MQRRLGALGDAKDADSPGAAIAQQSGRGHEGLQRDLTDVRRLAAAAEPPDRRRDYALTGEQSASLAFDAAARGGEYEDAATACGGRLGEEAFPRFSQLALGDLYDHAAHRRQVVLHIRHGCGLRPVSLVAPGSADETPGSLPNRSVRTWQRLLLADTPVYQEHRHTARLSPTPRYRHQVEMAQ